MEPGDLRRPEKVSDRDPAGREPGRSVPVPAPAAVSFGPMNPYELPWMWWASLAPIAATLLAELLEFLAVMLKPHRG